MLKNKITGKIISPSKGYIIETMMLRWMYDKARMDIMRSGYIRVSVGAATIDNRVMENDLDMLSRDQR